MVGLLVRLSGKKDYDCLARLLINYSHTRGIVRIRKASDHFSCGTDRPIHKILLVNLEDSHCRSHQSLSDETSLNLITLNHNDNFRTASHRLTPRSLIFEVTTKVSSRTSRPNLFYQSDCVARFAPFLELVSIFVKAED